MRRIKACAPSPCQSASGEATSQLQCSGLATCLGVHKNTVRHWQRDGLKPIDASRPLLFQGADIRAFLTKRNADRKQPCPSGTLYCFRCHAPRAPALAMLAYVAVNSASGNLRALCDSCSGMMHRRIRLVDLQSRMPGIDVQVRLAEQPLSGSPLPSLNCDFERQVHP